MSLNINQIDEYSLISIFNYLSLREKIAIERVCKRWQQIIADLLETQKGIQLARIPRWMKCDDLNHSTNDGDVCDYLNYPNDKHKVKKILLALMRKCPKMKCIELSWSSLELKEGIHLFSWLLWLCPNLECIRVFVNDSKTIHGFGKAIDIIGSQVKHFAAYQSNNLIKSTNINALLNKMPALTQLVLLGFQMETSNSFKMGHHLNELVTDCFNPNNINAIVRCNKIESLKMFGALDQLGFTQICQNMPQLKHLTARFNETVHDFSPLIQIDSLQTFGISSINYYELKDISSTRMVFNKKNQVFPDLTKTCHAFVTELSVKKLVLNNLHSFGLYGISIDKNMLNILAVELPNIEELILNKCCFVCECSPKIENCNACQAECCLLLSKWPKLSRLTFDHPENQLLIENLHEFNRLSFITINHIRLHPNNRFYSDNNNAWIHCYDIFISCHRLAIKTKVQIQVNLNIHLDNIIRIKVKTLNNLRFNFNYFSN